MVKHGKTEIVTHSGENINITLIESIILFKLQLHIL